MYYDLVRQGTPTLIQDRDLSRTLVAFVRDAAACDGQKIHPTKASDGLVLVWIFEKINICGVSLYTKMLRRAERVRALIGANLNDDHPLVFAINTSTWVRNDAKTSPQRGYFYHPSRRSAGKPMVAGWCYSWVAQRGPVSSSWSAPLDVRRAAPGRTVHEMADQQVQHVVNLLLTGVVSPLFVFDGGYDPIRLAKLKDADRVSVLVRVRRNRRFFFDATARPGPQRGWPRIHGAKFLCTDQTTWPAAHLEHVETTEQYGTVHVRAWTGLHVKTSQDTQPGSRHFTPT